MSAPRDVHRAATRLMSAVMVVLGLAMIASTVAGGGGPFALGILLGVMFVAAGAGRIYVSTRGG